MFAPKLSDAVKRQLESEMNSPFQVIHHRQRIEAMKPVDFPPAPASNRQEKPKARARQERLSAFRPAPQRTTSAAPKPTSAPASGAKEPKARKRICRGFAEMADHLKRQES